MIDAEINEYERIVEYSFQVKSRQFVIRFLSGAIYTLKINDLPKRLHSKKIDWESACFSPNHTSLIVQAGKEIREIPSHMVYARGRVL